MGLKFSFMKFIRWRNMEGNYVDDQSFLWEGKRVISPFKKKKVFFFLSVSKGRTLTSSLIV